MGCVKKYSFLAAYSGLAVSVITKNTGGAASWFVCWPHFRFSLEIVGHQLENLDALAPKFLCIVNLAMNQAGFFLRVSTVDLGLPLDWRVNIHSSTFSVDVEGSDDGPGEAKKRKVVEKEAEENGVSQTGKGYTITFSVSSLIACEGSRNDLERARVHDFELNAQPRQLWVLSECSPRFEPNGP